MGFSNTLFIKLHLLLLCIMLHGCFTPMNTTFESAELLGKGQLELQGSYSEYYGDGALLIITEDLEDFTNLTRNFGFAVGYGITDNFDIKLRYERINHDYFLNWLDEPFGVDLGMNYFEINNKISLFHSKKDIMSFGLPLGAYFAGDGALFKLQPRLYYTYRHSDKFELNVIPKAHVFIGGGGVGAIPAMSMGIGLSTDLNQWAVRPEIGYDMFGAFSFGVGMNFYIRNKSSQTSLD